MQTVSTFIHSPDFWKWHGLVLSVLWLFGSAIGIMLKKKGIKLHLAAFVIVDYISLFFMGSALYLILPRLPNFFKWSFMERLHVAGGLIFLVLMIIQHIGGAVSWHKEERNYSHRKLGTKLAIAGRILAAIGWMIQEHNKVYAIGMVALSLVMYIGAERSSWSKIKTS